MKMKTSKRLATVKQMPEIYPVLSPSSIRWLIQNEEKNGFSQCMRRIGGKIIIDLDCFETWIERHQKLPKNRLKVDK